MKYSKLFLFLSIITLSTFSACSKKSVVTEIKEPLPLENKDSHKWYYFSLDNINPIDKPKNAAERPFLPWTEARRVSSASTALNQNGENLSYAVVNRLGLITFNNSGFKLSKDNNLFNDRTSGNLIFLNDVPIFSVYKSAFFNDTITDPFYKSDSQNHLFLIQFDSSSGIFYPIINCNNLTKLINTEITDFYWDGLDWACSLKTITDTKNIFSYINFRPSTSLLNLSPGNADSCLEISESSLEEFKEKKTLKEISKAPQRIQKLLKGFSDKKNFYLELKKAGGVSPVKYQNSPSQKEDFLNAKGIIADSWSAILFEDGTLFLEGAIPGKHILREGKTIALRLPKLPAGFIYSDFVISGSRLYAFWEEADFFNTGRAGMLEVNLENTLYSKIR